MNPLNEIIRGYDVLDVIQKRKAHLLVIILKMIHLRKTQIVLNRYIFIITSFNQYKTLAPLLNNLPSNCYSILTNKNMTSMFHLEDIVRIDKLPFSFKKVVRQIIKSRTKSLRIIYAAIMFDKYSSILGMSEKATLFVANDHEIHIRAALVSALRISHIETIYIQHAMVSEKFPQLISDISFLYGKHASKCYKKLNDSIKIASYFGMLDINLTRWYESQLNRNSSENIARIGVAINSLDSIELVKTFCVQLKDKGIAPVLKLHPAMSFSSSWIREFEVYKETNEFFTNISALVSCESSIHIDAVVRKVPTFYYSFLDTVNRKHRDYYGFIKMGCLPELKKVDSITDDLLCSYDFNAWSNVVAGPLNASSILNDLNVTS